MVLRLKKNCKRKGKRCPLTFFLNGIIDTAYALLKAGILMADTNIKLSFSSLYNIFNMIIKERISIFKVSPSTLNCVVFNTLLVCFNNLSVFIKAIS